MDNPPKWRRDTLSLTLDGSACLKITPPAPFKRSSVTMNESQRDQFDELLDAVLADLPDHYRRLLDEKPLIVDDVPTAPLLYDIARTRQPPVRNLNAFAAGLCGLHSGVPLTMRSVHHAMRMPEEIRLFRDAIVRVAGGWNRPGAAERIREQVRITLLHEIGHHFGLGEEDLRLLGYG